MDDLTFDYDLADVAAGHARFPDRPLRTTSRAGASDVGAELERGTAFAQHAWDESGRL